MLEQSVSDTNDDDELGTCDRPWCRVDVADSDDVLAILLATFPAAVDVVVVVVTVGIVFTPLPRTHPMPEPSSSSSSSSMLVSSSSEYGSRFVDRRIRARNVGDDESGEADIGDAPAPEDEASGYPRRIDDCWGCPPPSFSSSKLESFRNTDNGRNPPPRCIAHSYACLVTDVGLEMFTTCTSGDVCSQIR